MYKLIFLILSYLISESKNTIGSSSIFQTNQNNDTTITVFGDSNYKLKLEVNYETDNYEDYNATLTFTKLKNGKTISLFTDSLLCQRAFIEMRDFNNDKIKDILVFHTTGVRSNWTHYLYLVNKKNKKLIFVKGFENICNPEFDSRYNVIYGYGLAGKIYFSFYRINKKNELIDFNKSFESEIGDEDSVRYQKTIQEIRKIKN